MMMMLLAMMIIIIQIDRYRDINESYALFLLAAIDLFGEFFFGIQMPTN
jgi:hypothetical protein